MSNRLNSMSYLSKLTSRAAQWDVAIDEVRETEGSLLGFGVRNGVAVVLKISKATGDEWHSGDVLKAFAGHGTVRVYESDKGAVLLERLDPGNELVELVREGKDQEATSIIAQVMRRMVNHEPPVSSPTVFDWARGFDRYFAQPTNALIPPDLVSEAGELYRKLAESQQHTMLLHGDLHHYNVLFDTKGGWVAIDPKGVVGEIEYDVGAIIRNPVEQPNLFTQREVVERRLKMLTAALNLNYQRALQWAFAQAVLSAIWDIEDAFPVGPNHSCLQLATVIRPLLP